MQKFYFPIIPIFLQINYIILNAWSIFVQSSMITLKIQLRKQIPSAAFLFVEAIMLTGLFLKGSLIGFSVAMPIGPVGVVCIQHSLRRGLLAGLIAGSGAALADAFFGCTAGFGISLLSHVVTRYQVWFQILGALILWILGIKIFRSPPLTVLSPATSFSHKRIFFSTFALTLTNPLTLICFAAIYASLGIAPAEDEVLPGIILTFGVLLGAALWWSLLILGVTLIGKKFPVSSSPLFNRISGSILTGCGFLASVSALKQLIFLI